MWVVVVRGSALSPPEVEEELAPAAPGAPLGALIGAAVGGARRTDAWQLAALPPVRPGPPAAIGIPPRPGMPPDTRRAVAITIRF
jgi:hypothetical protein